jgi:thiol-disulfide isomerase/thioredoxin
VSARWKRLVLEALVFIVIVVGIQAWRARDLLPAGERSALPRFELVDLHGRRWSSEDLAGKPTVLYFFAPWCGVCAASSPQLRWFDRWRGQDVRLVMVGLDWANVAELRDYANRHRLSMPVLIGDGATGAAFRIRGYPTYYVIDRTGRIARHDVGFTSLPGLWLRTVGL